MVGQENTFALKGILQTNQPINEILSKPLRYYNLSSYLRSRFGRNIGKIALDAGLSCPNRDGTISSQGCLFCNARGSGTGASGRGLSPEEQLARKLTSKTGEDRKYIAYFQSYTNTYAPVERLEHMWRQAVLPDNVVGLSIGTRPDCLPSDVLDLLADIALSREVWLELGLQSACDRTLARINRGHDVDAFRRAVAVAGRRNIKVIAHVILGLPGEGEAEILHTAEFISNLGLAGVKIHSLYVSGDSGLARWYAEGQYQCLSREEFVRLAVMVLERIPSDMVVHRLTGDPDPDTLVAPEWALDKHRTIHLIRRRMEETDTWQGRLYRRS